MVERPIVGGIEGPKEVWISDYHPFYHIRRKRCLLLEPKTMMLHHNELIGFQVFFRVIAQNSFGGFQHEGYQTRQTTTITISPVDAFMHWHDC